MADNEAVFSIGVVERDTGIGRDTLRVWERRYGFPEPRRNARGERVYSERQLQRLLRIRRLMDQGLRPGKLLPLDEQQLDALEDSLRPGADSPPEGPVLDLLDAIGSTRGDRVAELLQASFQQQGMQAFILETVAPLLKAVGDSWASGDIN